MRRKLSQWIPDVIQILAQNNDYLTAKDVAEFFNCRFAIGLSTSDIRYILETAMDNDEPIVKQKIGNAHPKYSVMQ